MEKKEYINVGYVDDKYKENVIAIKSKGKWGFLNLEGEMIIAIEYDNAQEFSEGLAPVYLNKKWGFINKKGETVIDFIYDDAGCFSEGLAPVQINENWFYIDKTGNTILSLDESFFEASPFKEGKAIVHSENQLCSFIDKSGNILKTESFDDINPFSEGCAVVERDSNFGYINENGEIIIPLQYKFAYEFVNGFASVQKQDETWLVIDKGGKEIPCFANYNFVLFTKDGVNLASKDKKWGVINNGGEIIIPLEYDKAPVINNHAFGVFKDEKWGIINKKNEIVLPFEYVQMNSLNENRFVVTKEDKQFAYIIDTDGNKMATIQLEGYAAVKKIKTTVQLLKLAIIAVAFLGIILIFTQC